MGPDVPRSRRPRYAHDEFEFEPLSLVNWKDLAILKELLEAGKITPIIGRTYPLSDVPTADWRGSLTQGDGRPGARQLQ
jgi:hypothetical protein